jgi:hypothetical protein
VLTSCPAAFNSPSSNLPLPFAISACLLACFWLKWARSRDRISPYSEIKTRHPQGCDWPQDCRMLLSLDCDWPHDAVYSYRWTVIGRMMQYIPIAGL